MQKEDALSPSVLLWLYSGNRIPNMKDARKAFTLVELLVVIAIIALLLAILLPSLERAKKQTTRVMCMSNMRQVTLGIMLYAADNQNYVPSGIRKGSYPLTDYGLWTKADGWIGVGKLYELKYLNNHKVFFCPSTQSTTRKGLQFTVDYEWYDRNGGEVIQGTLYHRGAFDWKLDAPERAPYTQANPAASYAFVPSKRPYTMLSCITLDFYPYKLGHLLLGGRPVTLSDGSVKWITFKKVPTNRFGYSDWKKLDRQ
jgi:prepilin-type N-terminal cleavage/methylation domain-containing protein